MKNFTNRKIKAAEAEYYKNLIKSAVGSREMWHSLNSVLGTKKEEGSAFQVQDSKYILSEAKAEASKFNKLFTTFENKVASKLPVVAKDAWKKYESNLRAEIDNLLDLQSVDSKAVREI